MAPAPPRRMIVVVAMVVSLTPAVGQRETEKRSAPGATFTVTAPVNQTGMSILAAIGRVLDPGRGETLAFP